MIKRTAGCVVLGGWLMASGSLHAHHSLAGAYALGSEAKVTGAFQEFRLVNPHSSMKLEVTNADGSTTEWAMTGGNPGTLARLGVGRSGPNALNRGDNITVTYVPPLDGKSPVGLLVAITYPDGHTVVFRRSDQDD
jgi:hypothetical protein